MSGPLANFHQLIIDRVASDTTGMARWRNEVNLVPRAYSYKLAVRTFHCYLHINHQTIDNVKGPTPAPATALPKAPIHALHIVRLAMLAMPGMKSIGV